MKIVPGNWIRKNNYTCFRKCKHMEGELETDKENAIPILLVNTIKNKNYNVLINGVYLQDESFIKIITPEEASYMLGVWDNFILSQTTHPNDITSCVREDNGEYKVKVTGKRAIKEILFVSKMKNPSGNYEAYKCNHCGSYHIGKRDINEILIS